MSNEDIIKNITAYVYMEAENIPSAVVKALDAAKEAVKKADKYRWHDLRKDPEDLPVNEHEVDIAYIGYKGIKKTARAIYEDGTMHSEDSVFCYTELDDWCEYCEETDDYIIPQGWLEITHFAENMGIIDCEVIAWREIETFEEEDNERKVD